MHRSLNQQVYFLIFLRQMQLQRELTVAAPSMGRFGATISSLADLNGDGLRDVAVGAPLENDNTGTVYIYLGDRHRGIRSAFSQVRQTTPVSLKLRQEHHLNSILTHSCLLWHLVDFNILLPFILLHHLLRCIVLLFF